MFLAPLMSGYTGRSIRTSEKKEMAHQYKTVDDIPVNRDDLEGAQGQRHMAQVDFHDSLMSLLDPGGEVQDYARVENHMGGNQA
jgi:hypothetical protein